MLTADDLEPYGPLAQAASISHLIVWKSAIKQAADDEASPGPVGETGNSGPAVAGPAKYPEAKETQGSSAKRRPRQPPHRALSDGKAKTAGMLKTSLVNRDQRASSRHIGRRPDSRRPSVPRPNGYAATHLPPRLTDIRICREECVAIGMLMHPNLRTIEG